MQKKGLLLYCDGTLCIFGITEDGAGISHLFSHSLQLKQKKQKTLLSNIYSKQITNHPNESKHHLKQSRIREIKEETK